MKCIEVYKNIYHQEPFDVAFCPYRISPLGAHMAFMVVASQVQVSRDAVWL